MRASVRLLVLSPFAAREILLAAPVLLAAGVGLWFVEPMLASVPLVALAGFLAFFRDPRRRVPSQAGVLLAPADGRVVDIEELDEPEFLRARAIRVGVFLSIFDVHLNRAPLDATVELVRHCEGRHRAALTARGTEANESNLVGLRAPDGSPVLVKQISGAVARRIVCRVEVGDGVRAGERFGMIKFGSRTELYVPVSRLDRLLVGVGSRVRAGESIVGVLRT